VKLRVALRDSGRHHVKLHAGILMELSPQIPGISRRTDAVVVEY